MIDIDEIEVLSQSAEKLEAASTIEERRSALREWLAAVCILAEDFGGPRASEPGKLLDAALAGLGQGYAAPVLRPVTPSRSVSAEVSAAIGRAIAAVDFLYERGIKVPVAANAVDQVIGQPLGTAERWRENSRSARRHHAEAAALVPDIKKQWDFLDTLPANLRGGTMVETVCAELAKDRVIHSNI